MRSSLWVLALICALYVVPPPAVLAETSNDEVVYELKEMKKALQAQNELIKKQQAKIEGLEKKMGTVVGRTESIPPAAPAKEFTLPGQIGALLPEIGVVADIVGTASEDSEDRDGNDRVSVRALELILGSYVDPYSRLDATIHFSDIEGEEAAIDEAYLTRWGLPFDLTGRFGRFFPKVGKSASVHRDSLSTVDQPLVIRRYFGGEGYFRTGADLGGKFEGPWSWVFEPTAGILEGGTGHGGTMFGENHRRPTLYSHLKSYKDLSESSGMEFGLTHLVGSGDDDAVFEVNVLGVDATYLNALTPTSKLKLQSELFVQQRDEAFTIDDDTGELTRFSRHPWGAYALAEYRFAPRWAVGARADHVRLVDSAASRPYDQGVSAFLTFHQSEWARWRLQVRHEEQRGDEEISDTAIFLQGTFAIGTHKHKLQ